MPAFSSWRKRQMGAILQTGRIGPILEAGSPVHRMTDHLTSAILRVETMLGTGLYHGTLRTEDPTPSGCPRWRLRASTTEGFTKASEAASAIADAHPDLAPPSIEGMPDIVPLPAPPTGFVATRITPVDGSAASWETPDRQVLDTGTMNRLLACGRIEIESSSGRDPMLSAVYDHFVPVP